MNIAKVNVEQLKQNPIIATQIQQLQLDKISAVSNDNTKLKAVKINDELPWRITPGGTNSLLKNYLMLSKIRLTCKFFQCDSSSG